VIARGEMARVPGDKALNVYLSGRVASLTIQ
jgi:hypothetical protein